MIIRVLFVEKDLTSADLLVPSLERKGYEVTVAHTLRQASSRARTARPDLLIIDVASFGPRGYSVREALRKRQEGVATLLLLPEGHESAGSGAEAFLTPPFTSRRLLYRIKKLARSLPDREIQTGGLALDPETRTLRKGETAVQLRPKEADLLSLFMRRRGKVLSRREIMKKVWQTDYMEDTRTLNVHVCWLRTKIEDELGAERCLRTVRGVGYRFDGPEPAIQTPPRGRVSEEEREL